MSRLFTVRPFVGLPVDVRDWSRFFQNIVIEGLYTGQGSPEGVVTATVGSLYTRANGGAGTTLYVKESGSGKTGWVAK